MLLRKAISGFILILIIGGMGGVLANEFLLPYLVSFPFFARFAFIGKAENGTTIINKTEKIVIEESSKLKEAISKVSSSVVGIKSYNDEKILTEGTGFIVTSDGMIITASVLVPPLATKYHLIRESQRFMGEVIGRDEENGLALLRIRESNLPVVSFGVMEELHLGERVVLVALDARENFVSRFVKSGIIKSLRKRIISLDMGRASQLANGSPLINARGEVIGLNLVSAEGEISVISVEEVRGFIKGVIR